MFGKKFAEYWIENPGADVVALPKERLRYSITKIRYKFKTRNCMLMSYGLWGDWTIRVTTHFEGQTPDDWFFNHISGDHR
jgi:hypothetical protein